MRSTLLFLAFAVFTFQAFAQQPAFPGAEGAGMFTTGGRGNASFPTAVYEVTNLTDVNSPGSLRYACSQSTGTVPFRTIVFRVGGTIHLTSKLNIPGGTTIAGQTAPGGGICLADFPVVISGDHVILRYIRCRMGDKNQLKTSPASCGVPVAPFTASCMPLDGSGGDDALGNLGNKHIIVDHCTVSWSSDEALTMYRGDSLTLQWNLVSEPLNYSYHFETGDADFENHGYGGIWGSRHGSFHHNLIAHARNRTPRFAGVSTYTNPAPGAEMADFRNNVLYNWGINNIYGGEGGYYNVVNNYMKFGPNTSSSRKNQIVAIDSGGGYPYARYYLSGNVNTSSTTNSNNNWLGVAMKSGLLSDTSLSKVSTPWPLPAITQQTATGAYDLVLLYSGCVKPFRDTLDQRIITDVINGTGRIIDVQGGFPHATPYAQTVNAWPDLAPGTAVTDTDHDGMPDSWETARGLNPNSAADRAFVNSNGYTNLENYLNSLALDGFITDGNLNAFQQNIGTPSASQSYTFAAQNLSGNVTITPSANFEVSVNGTNWFNNGNPLVLTASNGSITSQPIMVRLNANAVGSYAGTLKQSTALGTSTQINLTGSTTPVTGISNPSLDPNYRIYPNPAQNTMTIQHPAVTADSQQFYIFSQDGKLVNAVRAARGSKTTSMTVSQLATGQYYVSTQNTAGTYRCSFVKLN